MRVVNSRIETLLDVGSWPQDGIKDCYSQQVKWIVKVQGLLQDIIDFANPNDKLGAVIYNRHQLANILKLFPMFMLDELAEIPGYNEDKFKLIIEKLDKWKNISLNRYSILGQPAQQKSHPVSSRTDKVTVTASGNVNFPKPRKLSSCRICKVLEVQGKHDNLYEGHISDYATGCPKFVNLGTEQQMVSFM